MPMVRVSNGGTTVQLINIVSNPISGLTIVPNLLTKDGDHYVASGASAGSVVGVVVRNTTSKRYGILVTYTSTAYAQGGFCSTTATLPTIISQGAGRGSFSTAYQVYANTLMTSGTENSAMFIGTADPGVNPNNMKLYVYAIDCSKLT